MPCIVLRENILVSSRFSTKKNITEKKMFPSRSLDVKILFFDKVTKKITKDKRNKQKPKKNILFIFVKNLHIPFI